MWLRIRMEKNPNPQNPFHFVYPRILAYNFLKMKTNSYSVNVSQCIHVKQCFLLLKLKHTYCPEMPTIFYKRELSSTAQNYSKGPLWSCSVLLAVTDMNWIPATKSKFGFKFTAVSLCWTRFTLQVYNPLHFAGLWSGFWNTALEQNRFCGPGTAFSRSWQPILEAIWVSQVWREAGQLLRSLSCLYY